MGKVSFGKVDTDLLQKKLSKLNDIENRIADLINKLSKDNLYALKPKEFYRISQKVHDVYQNNKNSPYVDNLKDSSLLEAAVSMDNNEVYNLNGDFASSAAFLISKIKNVRDIIESSDSSVLPVHVLPVTPVNPDVSETNRSNDQVDLSILPGSEKDTEEIVLGDVAFDLTNIIGDYVLPNNEVISIREGEYQVIKYLYDDKGNVIGIIIEKDGKYITLEIKDGKVVDVLKVENATIKIDEKISAYKNGELVEIEKGEYQVIKYLYDDKGNVIGVIIEKDGKYITLEIKDGKIANIIDISTVSTIITESLLDSHSSNLVNIDESKYKIIKYIYDNNGNVVAIIVEYNGTLKTLQVINGRVIDDENFTNNYELKTSIDIIMPDGSVLVLKEGNYQVIDCIHGVNGLEAVCIQKDDLKIWLYLDSNGNVVKLEYIKTTNGVFIIDGEKYYSIDKYGNKISLLSDGKYYIYEVKYDVKGNVKAIRISPNGQYELWIYTNKDNSSNFMLFENTIISDDKNKNLSLFEKNKSLLGLIGILFVALGGTLMIKKKKNKQEEVINLGEGNYPVYEVINDDNKVKARINSDDDDEYWVEM